MMNFWPFGKQQEGPSDAGKTLALVFQKDESGNEFLGSVQTEFTHFGQYYTTKNGKTLPNDLSHIIKATVNDITSKMKAKRSSERIDAYFYIYWRYKEYAAKLLNKHVYEVSLEDFEKPLFALIGYWFEKTAGAEPNLTTVDAHVLSRINIPRYLSSIRVIEDFSTLVKYFALMKLSIQSANYVNDQRPYVQWIWTLRSIGNLKCSLEAFVNVYLRYKEAFSTTLWDTSVFIYLIDKFYSSPAGQKLSIKTLINLHEKINPNADVFFEKFLPIFRSGISRGSFNSQDIVEIWYLAKGYDGLNQQYFETLADKGTLELIFGVMLLFCKQNPVNQNLEKFFIKSLSDKIKTMRLNDFQRWIETANQSIMEVNEELRKPLVRALVEVLDTFMSTKLPTIYSNPFERREYISLLNICMKFPSTEYFNKDSFKHLIHKIVIKIEGYHKNIPEKLKILFENIRVLPERFCNECDPKQIIEDTWLKDFFLNNIAIWSQVDKFTYRHLCENHQKNRWTIYIWSRIMHNSLINLSNASVVDVLTKLNDWMITIGHQEYRADDVLTIIFVQELFEIIMSKYSTSILSLPSIDAIIKFSIGIHEQVSESEREGSIKDFLQNGIEILKEILQLKSKLALLD